MFYALCWCKWILPQGLLSQYWATETPLLLPIANSPRGPCRWSSSRAGSCAWGARSHEDRAPQAEVVDVLREVVLGGWSHEDQTPEQTGLGGAYCKISYHKISFWSCKSTIALSVEQHDVIRSVFEVELECFPISHQNRQGSKWIIYHDTMLFNYYPQETNNKTTK